MQILTTRTRSGDAARARLHSGFVVATVATGVIVAVVVALAVVRPPFAAFMVAIALACAIAAAVVDVHARRIPDTLVVGVAASAAVVLVRGVVAGYGVDAAGSILVAAAAMSVPVLVIHVIDPAAMGFGDVKLAAALGAVIGLADWRWTVAALCVASGSTAAVGLVGRARALPLAPGLVAGTFVAFAGVAATGGELVPWR